MQPHISERVQNCLPLLPLKENENGENSCASIKGVLDVLAHW